MTRMSLAAVVFVCVSLSQALTASQQGQADAGASQAEFEALLARVRQSDASVDFLRLRHLYAESDTYPLSRDPAEGPMIDAVVAGRHEEGLNVAREILARDYMNIEAHFASAVACQALGNMECVAHHTYVARGVIDSILAEGDGKTLATAYKVVSVPEEYALMRVFGLRVEGQSLVGTDDGHQYDVLTVRDTTTSEVSRVYFNIDASMAALSRKAGLK